LSHNVTEIGWCLGGMDQMHKQTEFVSDAELYY